MAGYHSFIGYPWIIDCLVKYQHAGAKQRPVPGQVIEFLRIPDHSVSSEDCQYPEAVVNISDQKYYIRAVITKEAQQMLESEDEHFTLVDIKNKIIILKKFSVCFAVVEDLSRCEFYLTVEHFSVLPMETNTVDLLNCNVEPGVRMKIKELWQDYMTELEMNKSSHDMNLSDVSLTQLLMVASEEKFSALKSIAEQCLELNPLVTQHNSPQDQTFWSTERRNQENTERFVIPVDLLLIPPHEEAILEQITAQPYCTALSTLSEDPIDEGPSKSGNPWNKLPSLCVSVATSSDSQPKRSPSVNEVGSDPDSSTPDIFKGDSDVSLADSSFGKSEISPLMFLENSSNPQQPCTGIPETDSTRSNTGLNYRQEKSSDSPAATLGLIPLTQNSPHRSLSGTSKVLISPIKFQISQVDSELKRSPENKGELFSLCDKSNRKNSPSTPQTRKATKRKPTSEDVESTLSDLEQQEPECVEIPDSASSSEESNKVSDHNNVLQTGVRRQIWEREAEGPVLEIEKNTRKTEQYIKTHVKQSRKGPQNRTQAHKPSLQFVVNPKILTTKVSANGPTPSKVCIQEAPANATPRQPSFQAKEKLVHLDGTPFQYKYKSPSEELCAHVKAIQIPAELCDWAVKILSEHQEKHL
ncbi:adrenocortical dysplasia protein homolog isoform X2 [Hyla sarda]|uniref:adrenocortical dysplasia protein homolog isoform X2 n=1 Tax=Hyla sarda TaxID=327740 RepID=UPI0024C3021C|nr:adrenocortical dysplasia protein homolog isoform X2 [Hyla sarda]